MDTSDALTTPDNSVVIADSIPAPHVRMYKSERGFNINIAELVKTYYESGIDAAKTIDIPSIVRQQRKGNESCDTPTLSEVGVTSVSYGTGFDFCQVVAGADGRPVNIDNVLFVSSDPASIGINHGTSSVEIGSYFAIGWKRRADQLILLYRVAGCEQYLSSEQQPLDRNNQPARPVAKLTCDLSGYMSRTWKGSTKYIPDALLALFKATEQRLQTDYNVPFYMDMIRMITTTPESKKIAEQMKEEAYGTVEFYEPEMFRQKIYSEVLNIRNSQYAKLPTGQGAARKVQPLQMVETLELKPDTNSIVVGLVIPRDENVSPVHYQTELTVDNFFDEDGRVALERGMVLKNSSFEKLRTELENRRDAVVTVHLASIR